MSKNALSVLATVNAPHKQKLNEGALAACLQDIEEAKAHPGWVSSFLGDVAPELQETFAQEHGIPKKELASFAKSFGEWSGEDYPLAA
jgi:hypothetical protein